MSLAPLGRAIRYLGRYRGIAAAAYIFLFLSTGAMLVVPQLVQNIIDAITNGFMAAQVQKVPAAFQGAVLEKLGWTAEQLASNQSGAETALVTAGVLILAFAVPESPRWHKGRLYFSDFYTHKVTAMDANGSTETVAEVPTRSGRSEDRSSATCSSRTSARPSRIVVTAKPRTRPPRSRSWKTLYEKPGRERRQARTAADRSVLHPARAWSFSARNSCAAPKRESSRRRRSPRRSLPRRGGVSKGRPHAPHGSMVTQPRRRSSIFRALSCGNPKSKGIPVAALMRRKASPSSLKRADFPSARACGSVMTSTADVPGRSPAAPR